MRKRILAMILTIAIACTLGLTAQAVEYTVTEVVPLGKYDSVRDFSEGLAAVCVGEPYNGGKWGFIDKTGKEVVPCQYDNVGDFSDGLAWVNMGGYSVENWDTLGGTWGFVDATGTEVIPCALTYGFVKDFHDGLAAVAVETGFNWASYAYIDKTGREVTLPDGETDAMGSVTKDLKRVEMKSGEYWDEVMEESFPVYKYGFVDTAGQEIVPCKYDGTKLFSEGLVAVNIGCDIWEIGGKWGFVDQTGKEVVPCKYDAVQVIDYYTVPYEYGFSEGLAAVRLDGKWGFVDKTGNEVIPCVYDDAQSFSEGLAAVRIGDYYTGKRGFIDRTGKEVVPCKYDEVSSFSEGLAAVRIGDYGTGKWGFIDKTGQEVVPCKYDEVNSFSDGLAAVYIGSFLNGKWGFISLKAVNTAYQRTQRVEVDGVPVIFPAYALKENGGETNYVKIRDFASIINQMTGMKFDVTWNGALGAVDVVTGKEYKSDGSELATPFSGDRAYETPEIKTLINGEEVALDTFQLKDDAGGGYTYYKLRDLGTALGVHVDWSADRGIYIETK